LRLRKPPCGTPQGEILQLFTNFLQHKNCVPRRSGFRPNVGNEETLSAHGIFNRRGHSRCATKIFRNHYHARYSAGRLHYGGGVSGYNNTVRIGRTTADPSCVLARRLGRHANYGICNGAEVGAVFSAEQRGGGGGASQFSIPEHAALWQAPFWDFNDLQNSMVASGASACDGNVQVGTDSNEGGTAHAVMWFGSAKTQVDLHTGPYLNTGLNSVNVSSNTQVGAGTLEKLIVNGIETKRTQSHLLLWHGTTKSLVDLHPAGWLDSFGQLFGPTTEVGYADKFDANQNFIANAFVWTGTAASAINLHQFLPGNFTCSQAYFMDVPTGVISGNAGDCVNTTAIVLWVPVH
jgi:hypothetical protein